MNNLTLSITTIGDLLLENKITRRGDGKPINNVRLTVPEYQRPYKWTARNAIQLLDDIIEAKIITRRFTALAHLSCIKIWMIKAWKDTTLWMVSSEP